MKAAIGILLLYLSIPLAIVAAQSVVTRELVTSPTRPVAQLAPIAQR